MAAMSDDDLRQAQELEEERMARIFEILDHLAEDDFEDAWFLAGELGIRHQWAPNSDFARAERMEIKR